MSIQQKDFYFYGKSHPRRHLLWSRGGSNDNTTRKWGIRNILKENSTWVNDSWENPPTQLNTIMNINVHSWWRLRDCAEESLAGICHMTASASLGETPQHKVSRTLPSILADLKNIVVWIVSTPLLIWKSSSPSTNPVVTLPSAPILSLLFYFLQDFQSSVSWWSFTIVSHKTQPNQILYI